MRTAPVGRRIRGRRVVALLASALPLLAENDHVVVQEAASSSSSSETTPAELAVVNDNGTDNNNNNNNNHNGVAASSSIITSSALVDTSSSVPLSAKEQQESGIIEMDENDSNNDSVISTTAQHVAATAAAASSFIMTASSRVVEDDALTSFPDLAEMNFAEPIFCPMTYRKTDWELESLLLHRKYNQTIAPSRIKNIKSRRRKRERERERPPRHHQSNSSSAEQQQQLLEKTVADDAAAAEAEDSVLTTKVDAVSEETDPKQQQQQQNTDSIADSSPAVPGDPKVDDGAKTEEEQTAAAMAEEENEKNAEIKQDTPLVDYASKSAGALVLEKSPKFEGASNLLNSDKDKYALIPCEEENKSVVFSLSEEIHIKQVAVANYERYSSHVKEFNILGSQTMGDWVGLGTFRATAQFGKQTFDLEEPSWARYLKFIFASHYGDEHYCTVSQISVYGSTMLQGFHEHWGEASEEDEEETKQIGDDDELAGEEDEDANASDGELDGDEDEETSQNDGELASEKVDDERIQNDSQVTSEEDMETQQNVELVQGNDSYPHQIIIGSDLIVPKGVDGNDNGDNDVPKELSVDEAMFLLGTYNSSNDFNALMGLMGGTDGALSAASICLSNHHPKKSRLRAAWDSLPSMPVLSLRESSSGRLTTKNPLRKTESPLSQEVALVSSSLRPLASVSGDIKKGVSSEERQKDSLTDSLAIKQIPEVIQEVIKTTSEIEVDLEKVQMHMLGGDKGFDTAVQENKKSGEPLNERKLDPVQKIAPSTDSTSDENISRESEVEVRERETRSSSSKDESIDTTTKHTASSLSQDAGDSTKDKRRASAKNEPENTMHETGQYIAQMLERLPSASCLKDLDFVALKAAKLKANGGSGARANAPAGGSAMEPIFKKLTDEIKILQASVSVHDQFAEESILCYQRVMMDLLIENQETRVSHEARITKIEQDARRGSFVLTVRDFLAGRIPFAENLLLKFVFFMRNSWETAWPKMRKTWEGSFVAVRYIWEVSFVSIRIVVTFGVASIRKIWAFPNDLVSTINRTLASMDEFVASEIARTSMGETQSSRAVWTEIVFAVCATLMVILFAVKFICATLMAFCQSFVSSLSDCFQYPLSFKLKESEEGGEALVVELPLPKASGEVDEATIDEPSLVEESPVTLPKSTGEVGESRVKEPPREVVEATLDGPSLEESPETSPEPTREVCETRVKELALSKTPTREVDEATIDEPSLVEESPETSPKPSGEVCETAAKSPLLPSPAASLVSSQSLSSESGSSGSDDKEKKRRSSESSVSPDKINNPCPTSPPRRHHSAGESLWSPCLSPPSTSLALAVAKLKRKEKLQALHSAVQKLSPKQTRRKEWALPTKAPKEEVGGSEAATMNEPPSIVEESPETSPKPPDRELRESLVKELLFLRQWQSAKEERRSEAAGGGEATQQQQQAVRKELALPPKPSISREVVCEAKIDELPLAEEEEESPPPPPPTVSALPNKKKPITTTTGGQAVSDDDDETTIPSPPPAANNNEQQQQRQQHSSEQPLLQLPLFRQWQSMKSSGSW